MREQQQPSSSQATAAFELGPAFVATVLLLLPLATRAARRARGACWLADCAHHAQCHELNSSRIRESRAKSTKRSTHSISWKTSQRRTLVGIQPDW